MIGLVTRHVNAVASAVTDELRKRLGHDWYVPNQEMTGAVVEIIDSTDFDDLGVLVPDRVLVNGHDVGYIAAGSVVVEAGSRSPGVATSVTFTLLASEVHVVARRP